MRSCTWWELCAMVTDRRTGDRDGHGFVPARFEYEADGIHVRRQRVNVIARTGVALDCEMNKVTGVIPPSLIEAGERIRSLGWLGAVYASHNYTRDLPRYRVFIPITHEIDPALPVVEVVAELLDLTDVLDSSKVGAASFFYLPSKAPDTDDGHDEYITYEGAPVDADWLVERATARLQAIEAEQAVLGVDDIDTAAPRDYLLKGLISPAEISIWVGPPKCGKSFLLLYIAYMLSLGHSVFGRRVKPTIVLYVAAEGEAGIANRIKALRDKYGRAPNFHFIAQPADLLHDNGHKAELVTAAQDIGAQLIVLDTLSRLLAGGDENAPGDMGTFVRNVSEVRHDTGAHIAIVHHGTKSSNGSNPRGHSSLTGADDALVEVTKHADGSRTATVVHAKDDAEGDRWGFSLDPVELGIDADRDPITTLLTVEIPGTPTAPKKTLTATQEIGMTALHSAMKASGVLANMGKDDAQISVVTEPIWRDWFLREKPGDNPESKERTFRRVADELKAKDKIGRLDGLVWPIP